MAEPIAKSPLDGRRPFTRRDTTLAEEAMQPIWSIALYPGQDKAVAKLLKPLGLSFPAPNEVSHSGSLSLLWTGRAQAFLLGARPPEALGEHAAITDQSDGWACLTLEGPLAADALARHVPVDLRAAAFPPGRVIRAPLGHMSAIIERSGPHAFRLFVFRSMARTAWHEVETALETLAARAALG